MCLILKSISVPDNFPDKVKAYKVYCVDNSSLKSPWNSSFKSGTIEEAGIYKSTEINYFSRESDFIKLPIEDLQFFLNKTIYIPGFHSFENKEDAKLYMFYLKAIYPKNQLVTIVEINIDKKDIFAFGNTELLKGKGFSMRLHSAKSLISTSITITPESFSESMVRQKEYCEEYNEKYGEVSV